jgi:hypothetical protein
MCICPYVWLLLFKTTTNRWRVLRTFFSTGQSQSKQSNPLDAKRQKSDICTFWGIAPGGCSSKRFSAQSVSSWPGALFQSRIYWDSSVLFWIPEEVIIYSVDTWPVHLLSTWEDTSTSCSLLGSLSTQRRRVFAGRRFHVLAGARWLRRLPLAI